ncbi:hypothetical protein BKA69DRAFT_442216 [Paraphysoderma sedebokerense]|nr:hypothetical protein BKA69DRAFT_442216 [Paraphysoderma sedebokerense]
MEDVTEFDELVKDLSRERLWLGGDIKFAEMRFHVLYEEWVLLKEFEKHDNALKEKLLVRRSERADLEVKIRDIQTKLMGKKKDVEDIIKKGKEVEIELRIMLGENNKYEDILTKIFRKRIKRPKRRNKSNSNDASATAQESQDIEEINEDFESDTESDYSSASSDGETEKEICDGCPPGCDEKIYQRVIELRDLRLDHEFDLSEIQSSIEAMRKENDALMKRVKLVDSALKQTESEIQEFQTQKQQKLNEINATIPMRLHQIQYFENDALPSDMSQALVFVNDGLDRLGNRIAELEQENVDIQREHKEMKKIHVGLRKSKREKQSKLAELEERSNEVQILKFGQIIDLEKLERIGVNKTANELRSKLQEQDVQNLKEIHIANAEVTKLKDELTQATIQNTLKLDMLVQLTNKLCKLENTLNHFQSDMTAEYAEQHQMESQNKLTEVWVQ